MLQNIELSTRKPYASHFIGFSYIIDILHLRSVAIKERQ